MEDVGYGGVRGGDPRHNGEEVQSRGASFAGVQWVAPVDPLTGEADTRLCFMYAEMWRRVLDPQKDYLETLVALPEGLCRRYAENIAPVVYDCVLSSVLAVVKRLDLRYETSEESGRCVQRPKVPRLKSGRRLKPKRWRLEELGGLQSRRRPGNPAVRRCVGDDSPPRKLALPSESISAVLVT